MKTAERRTEWTMRYLVNGTPELAADNGHVFDSRADAERHIKVWSETFPTLVYTDVVYLHRRVWVGQWKE